MTAIVLVGRSGSAFAAEIGTMKINEEINALTMMGLDPLRFLVAPRVLAGILVTPVLTIYSDLLGGGWSLCHGGKGISVRDCLAPVDRGCRHQRCDGRHYQGLRFWWLGRRNWLSSWTADRVRCKRSGKFPITRSVVTSIFLIVLVDAVFAVIFFAIDF